MAEMRALLVQKNEDGKTHAEVTDVPESDLPDGDVTVAVEYSTVNYKDGLCIGPGGGLVRNYPHVPGIDFAGDTGNLFKPVFCHHTGIKCCTAGD